MSTFALKRWAVLAVVIVICVAGCKDNGAGPDKPEPWTPVFGTFTDSRDGKEYKTVKLNKATWMAENLNYVPEKDSALHFCYENKAENCANYGRLYDWTTAMAIDRIYRDSSWSGGDVGQRGICPNGWHLPSLREWENLINAVGGVKEPSGGIANGDIYSDAGKKLKSKSGWNQKDNGTNGNGTDDYGFTALPAGQGSPRSNQYFEIYGQFDFLGIFAFWWTATESKDKKREAWRVYIANYEDNVLTQIYQKWDGLYSVRCVQDT